MLTGAPGTGKSTVLQALTTLLDIEGISYGALECEQLAWGSPWLDPPAWLPQLAAVVALQRRAGRRLHVVSATTETTAELRAVVRAIGAQRSAVVLLEAPPDTVAERIAAREPEQWPGKRDLIAHARSLAVTMPRDVEGVDARVGTDGRDPFAVAGDVRLQLP